MPKTPRRQTKPNAKESEKPAAKSGSVVARKSRKKSASKPVVPAPSEPIDLDALSEKVRRLPAGSANPPATRAASDYEAHREAMGEKRRSQSRSGRDIGPIPACANPERRAACEHDFRLFCETYFPNKFPLAWSPTHLEVIADIQEIVPFGGNKATAMPRGSGKTTLYVTGGVWGLVYAKRRFIVLIAAEKSKADNLLDDIRMDLEHNDLLAEDFPEICYPIRALEGINQRAAGQLCEGERTNIHITTESITLPTIRGSKASGGTVAVAGITGSLRGLRAPTLTGEVLRPDLAMIDDPQTDESANSETQCAQRERKVLSAVVNLAGPGKRLAALMACTVIRKGDMADRFLTRSIHPEWRGTRGRLMVSMPTNEELWEKYGDLYRAGREAGDISKATRFYKRNRKKMNEGAEAAWPERFITGSGQGEKIDEVDAVQHAMNIYLVDAEGFWAEYQNEPRSPEDEAVDQPVASVIAARLNNLPRAVVPVDATRLVSFIDVQKSALFYVVAAFNERFGGAIVHYGTEPEQKTAYFSYRSIVRSGKNTLQSAMPGDSLEAQLYGGLSRLTDRLLPLAWRNESGVEQSIELCLIDSAWGQSDPTVMKFVRQSRWKNILRPSRGMGIGAGKAPMREWAKKAGERRGLNWVIRPSSVGKATRLVLYDANYWKSLFHARLAAPMGDPSAMALFGDDPDRHRLLSEHLCAEKRVRTYGPNGREVDEYHLPAHQPDNHWLDGGVGCCVAASILGVNLEQNESVKRRAPVGQRVKASEVLRKKRMQRGAA